MVHYGMVWFCWLVFALYTPQRRAFEEEAENRPSHFARTRAEEAPEAGESDPETGKNGAKAQAHR